MLTQLVILIVYFIFGYQLYCQIFQRNYTTSLGLSLITYSIPFSEQLHKEIETVDQKNQFRLVFAMNVPFENADVINASYSITCRKHFSSSGKRVYDFQLATGMFDNRKGSQHVSGVYRRLDNICKNRIFNYGKRLMYEFMIPRPLYSGRKPWKR